jgi:hypothetical protein
MKGWILHIVHLAVMVLLRLPNQLNLFWRIIEEIIEDTERRMGIDIRLV